MKEATQWIAEDGKRFDSREACERYENEHGYTGPIADYLTEKGHHDGPGRAMRRNAIAGYLAWERERLEHANQQGEGVAAA